MTCIGFATCFRNPRGRTRSWNGFRSAPTSNSLFLERALYISLVSCGIPENPCPQGRNSTRIFGLAFGVAGRKGRGAPVSFIITYLEADCSSQAIKIPNAPAPQCDGSARQKHQALPRVPSDRPAAPSEKSRPRQEFFRCVSPKRRRDASWLDRYGYALPGASDGVAQWNVS
jgi:hypothetical protein